VKTKPMASGKKKEKSWTLGKKKSWTLGKK
jgi:hypothetical protein